VNANDPVQDTVDREDCLLHFNMEEEIALPQEHRPAGLPAARTQDRAQEAAHNRTTQRGEHGERSMIGKLSRPKRNPKVVPIDQPEPISPDRPRLIASDKVTKRVIIAIGG
jgi:hypothetical protein